MVAKSAQSICFPSQMPVLNIMLPPKCEIAILTANSSSLQPLHKQIHAVCGIDLDAGGVGADGHRFFIVGCQDIPGFEAVRDGLAVPVDKVTPGMVQLVRGVMREHPHLGAILLECTEMPPYADVLRMVTGLPVYDSITTFDFFMSGLLDSRAFGHVFHHSTDAIAIERCAEEEFLRMSHALSNEEKFRLVNRGSIHMADEVLTDEEEVGRSTVQKKSWIFSA